MKREIQSINIRYFSHYDGETLPDQSVVVTYRLLDAENNLLRNDCIVIYPTTDYSIYEEKIQQICKIAFENV